MESIHEYRVEAIGAGGRNGFVHAEGILPAISFSPPPEFQGELGRWTPEHFLAAAVASCFISTLRAWHRPHVRNLILYDRPWKVSSPSRIAVVALTEIRLMPAVTLRKEKIETGPFAFLSCFSSSVIFT